MVITFDGVPRTGKHRFSKEVGDRHFPFCCRHADVLVLCWSELEFHGHSLVVVRCCGLFLCHSGAPCWLTQNSPIRSMWSHWNLRCNGIIGNTNDQHPGLDFVGDPGKSIRRHYTLAVPLLFIHRESEPCDAGTFACDKVSAFERYAFSTDADCWFAAYSVQLRSQSRSFIDY